MCSINDDNLAQTLPITTLRRYEIYSEILCEPTILQWTINLKRDIKNLSIEQLSEQSPHLDVTYINTSDFLTIHNIATGVTVVILAGDHFNHSFLHHPVIFNVSTSDMLSYHEQAAE